MAILQEDLALSNRRPCVMLHGNRPHQLIGNSAGRGGNERIFACLPGKLAGWPRPLLANECFLDGPKTAIRSFACNEEATDKRRESDLDASGLTSPPPPLLHAPPVAVV